MRRAVFRVLLLLPALGPVAVVYLGTPWSAVAVSCAVALACWWPIYSYLGPWLLPWDIVYFDEETGECIEVWGRKQTLDVNSALFREVIMVVRASIHLGRYASRNLATIEIYKHIRVTEEGKKPRRKFGVVVPRIRAADGSPRPTMFLTYRGVRNNRVLYEETAHALERTEDGERVRYRDHLVIFEGLKKSDYFPRLSWWNKALVEAAICGLSADPPEGFWWRYEWRLAKLIRRFHLYR